MPALNPAIPPVPATPANLTAVLNDRLQRISGMVGALSAAQTAAAAAAADSIDTGSVTVSDLAGTGTRMVTADASGALGTQALPSSGVTTQSVVTGSRALGTIYHNTGLTPMMVTVTVGCVAAGGANFGQAKALTDASSTPTTVVASTFNGSATATVYEHLTFWVLPGHYYEVAIVTTTVSLVSWTEWN